MSQLLRDPVRIKVEAKMRSVILVAFLSTVIAVLSGCRNGGFVDLNGLHHMPWAEKPDRMPGVIAPHERLSLYQSLTQEARHADSGRREEIATRLAREIKDEVDPMLRAEIIRSLGRIDSPTSLIVLEAAMKDSSDRVRMLACEAWGRVGGDRALVALEAAVASDPCVDVRLAATRALGEIRHPGAIAVLGRGLNDRDPAIQYRSMQSLKQVTGENFGDNVGHWQEYIATGRPPEGASVSLAERMQGMFR